MTKLFKRRDPDTLTQRQKDSRDLLWIITRSVGIAAATLAICGSIIMHFDRQGMKEVRAEEERTERVWSKHLLEIEQRNHISQLELRTNYTSILYIGRATYINYMDERCSAPVIGDGSVTDLVLEYGEDFPEIDIVFDKEVCATR